MNKQGLHSRNKHQGHYDFPVLIKSFPELSKFIQRNPKNIETIDFSNPQAVRILNKALLHHYYGVKEWNIPSNYLCPPIPGRADYIHHMADLLAKYNDGILPKGKRVKCLDIGLGASGIYPIIGIKEYGWDFIGSETDTRAIESVEKIKSANSFLSENLEIKHQRKLSNFFKGIITPGDKIDLAICNPPFHTSAEAAKSGSLRKVNNLNKGRVKSPTLNFGGKSNELWCEGGEKKFIRDMIFESRNFKNSCFWFSSLVSKESNLKSIYSALKQANVPLTETLPMGQGNKTSRVVAWSFYSEEQINKWRDRS